MEHPERNFNITIFCRVDLSKVISGDISIEQVEREAGYFIEDIIALQKKYAGWIQDISNATDWNKDLKNLKL